VGRGAKRWGGGKVRRGWGGEVRRGLGGRPRGEVQIGVKLDKLPATIAIYIRVLIS
jgi:hypothetical protein